MSTVSDPDTTEGKQKQASSVPEQLKMIREFYAQVHFARKITAV